MLRRQTLCSILALAHELIGTYNKYNEVTKYKLNNTNNFHLLSNSKVNNITKTNTEHTMALVSLFQQQMSNMANKNASVVTN